MYIRRDPALLVISQCSLSIGEGAQAWSPLSIVDIGNTQLMGDLPRAAKPGKLIGNC